MYATVKIPILLLRAGGWTISIRKKICGLIPALYAELPNGMILLEVRASTTQLVLMYQKARAALQSCGPAGVIVRKLFNVNHISCKPDQLSQNSGSLEGKTRVVLECTERYH